MAMQSVGHKEHAKPAGRDSRPTRVIACGVFRPFIEQMRLEHTHPHVRVTYLPPSLHIRPDRLKAHLERALSDARGRAERIVCLVGNCFPDIDGFCGQQEVTRVSGPHCYAALLGEKRFQRIMDRCAGTYFVEQELLRNFDEYCAGPLELHDADLRQQFFSNYKVLLYVRQPSDPDLAADAGRLAGYLELELDVRDADYTHLEKSLLELL